MAEILIGLILLAVAAGFVAAGTWRRHANRSETNPARYVCDKCDDEHCVCERMDD
ncbi:MAG: hypothetical protein ACOWWM_08980 [Desulfobacterales bacterium]